MLETRYSSEHTRESRLSLQALRTISLNIQDAKLVEFTCCPKQFHSLAKPGGEHHETRMHFLYYHRVSHCMTLGIYFPLAFHLIATRIITCKSLTYAYSFNHLSMKREQSYFALSQMTSTCCPLEVHAFPFNSFTLHVHVSKSVNDK